MRKKIYADSGVHVRRQRSVCAQIAEFIARRDSCTTSDRLPLPDSPPPAKALPRPEPDPPGTAAAVTHADAAAEHASAAAATPLPITSLSAPPTLGERAKGRPALPFAGVNAAFGTEIAAMEGK